MELKRIPVYFEPEGHTYTNTETGASLSGVTSTLLRRVFPDKYGDVPRDILDAAAERGSRVHADIEMADSLGTDPSTEEGRNYRRLCAENGLRHIESEYLVSDMERYASAVDVVLADGSGGVVLADIKTTARLDTEYVSWQLSVYKMFFLMANPETKVTRLVAIWLRGDRARMEEVPEIPAGDICALIRADKEGKPFSWERPVPDEIGGYGDELILLKGRIDELTERYDSLRREVMESMERNGVRTCDLGRIKLTIREPSERTVFDSKAFRADNEELYRRYERTTKTGASLSITIR